MPRPLAARPAPHAVVQASRRPGVQASRRPVKLSTAPSARNHGRSVDCARGHDEILENAANPNRAACQSFFSYGGVGRWAAARAQSAAAAEKKKKRAARKPHSGGGDDARPGVRAHAAFPRTARARSAADSASVPQATGRRNTSIGGFFPVAVKGDRCQRRLSVCCDAQPGGGKGIVERAVLRALALWAHRRRRARVAWVRSRAADTTLRQHRARRVAHPQHTAPTAQGGSAERGRRHPRGSTH